METTKIYAKPSIQMMKDAMENIFSADIRWSRNAFGIQQMRMKLPGTLAFVKKCYAHIFPAVCRNSELPRER